MSGGLLVQVFPIRGKEIGAGVGINDGSPSLNRENSNVRHTVGVTLVADHCNFIVTD